MTTAAGPSASLNSNIILPKVAASASKPFLNAASRTMSPHLNMGKRKSFETSLKTPFPDPGIPVKANTLIDTTDHSRINYLINIR